jgi:hypothetical protein
VVSILGLVVVIAGPNRRPFVVLGLAVALMLCAAWDLDLTLQLLPCGVLGLLLTLVAAVIQWTVTRRRQAAASRFPGAQTGIVPSVSSAGPAVVDDGAEGSTAIRPRPPSVIDPFARPAVPPPEPASYVPDTGVRP